MIYLQSDDNKEMPHHFDVACAQFGAIDNAIPYKYVTYDEIASGKFDNLIRTNLFVGSVEFLREVFSRINKTPRVPINSNRNEKIMTLESAKRRAENGEVIFIKPYELKLFTGFVLDKDFISSLNPYPDDTKVIVSEPFKYEIVSEWRVYIHMNRIFDSRNYSGDLFQIPSESYINELIDMYKDSFPTAYTIDIGILENGENVVVEFNDMWAIGNYGMDNSDYLRLLKQRYFEIVR